ncbi:methyltransferase domain-containing protein [Pendulispora albinea]|uniref:Methyltransferase domain-containing protein n=1 Tax=Pendulispora albinea TaxID=2741071 RepID=A0ABZ2MAQ5_9BACT
MLANHAAIFATAYDDRRWGEGAGAGSTLEATRAYRAFIEQFIVERGIRSVLDLGCGDGGLSAAIDWKGARYLGIDVVGRLVQANRARFPNLAFAVGDAMELQPHAGFDLLIVKDVLQHWSHQTVLAFLAQPALASFRHVLITHCDHEWANNPDVEDGGWRPLNMLAAPFTAWGARSLRRFGTKRMVHRGPSLAARDLLERLEWWIISLDRRPDRLAHARAQLERIGVTKARRFQAFDGHRLQLTSQRPDWVRKGAVGCYLSHLALLKQAQARRAPCVIVEDDLVLVDDFATAFDAFVGEVPEDWDVLLLPGRWHREPPEVLGPHHCRLVATWGTAMSILRLPAIDRLLEEADSLDRPIDDYYIRMMPSLKFYAPRRDLVAQDGSLGTNIGDHG